MPRTPPSDRRPGTAANRVVEVHRKYRLAIDRREAGPLERVLSDCKSTKMVFDDGASASADPPDSGDTPSGGTAALAGTTIATDATPARKRDATASRRCGAAIRPIRATGTAMESYASETWGCRDPQQRLILLVLATTYWAIARYLGANEEKKHGMSSRNVYESAGSD